MISYVWHRFGPTAEIERSLDFYLSDETYVQLVGAPKRDVAVVVNGTETAILVDAVDMTLRGMSNLYLVGINFIRQRVCLLGGASCYILNSLGEVEESAVLNRSYDDTEYWNSSVVTCDECLVYVYERGMLRGVTAICISDGTSANLTPTGSSRYPPIASSSRTAGMNQ